ncbi:serine protease [Antarctobacter sp.]|uniref:trypsin-like serine peptidase n=1 Tax=Antarctobacter sp. TaxID=1872577 RepID=UPI002B266A25|nr:serine protease [Antarctobacter sp.]
MPIVARLTAAACAAMLSAVPLVAGPVPLEGFQTEVSVTGYNNEPINTYSENADFRKLGRGVGMLQIVHDAGQNPCTAFLVDDTHLLTNHHCIPGVLKDPRIGATKLISLTWVAGFLEPGRADEAQRFVVKPDPVETSAELDYTILEVVGVPTDLFPPLPLSDHEATEGMPYWIIGHPLGKSQHISREGCRAARPPIGPAPEFQGGVRLRHLCDTLGGNSGSPIIDSSSRQVIGLHNSGIEKIGVNFGIPMALIIENSKVLKVTPPTPTPDGKPRPLPLIMSLFPKELGVGQELSVVADVPETCTPAFVDISPNRKLTPIPLEIFEKVELSKIQTRYQVTATSTYGLEIQEEDEKGPHTIGYLCSSTGLDDATQLKAALRLVVAALGQGQMDGSVTIDSGTVNYSFGTYVVK